MNGSEELLVRPGTPEQQKFLNLEKFYKHLPGVGCIICLNNYGVRPD